MIRLRVEPDHLQLVVVFEQHGKILAAYIHPILKQEDERDAIVASYDQFHKEHPDISLFDFVTVRFDKVD